MSSIFEISPSLIRRRRLIFAGFNLLLLSLGVVPMTHFLAASEWTGLRIVLLVIFVILLGQVVFGFALAATGFWLQKRGGDRVRINNTLPPDWKPDNLAATAIVMPIANEDVGRVFQGLRVMYESLQRTGSAGAFDFFVLSDSNDVNKWIAEEMAWLELCKQVGGFGRIFYRKRRVTLHHKSGNVADFCRRWGGAYRYMIVLDADSVMTGAAFVRLVGLMEQNPRTGIIQTCPRQVLGASLFQRVMQFGARGYGPMFAAGANYWQLDGGNYWGHNAIVRLKPFIKFCAMPELPARGPLGTRVLSHDTIEAALMRRAGYAVWLAYDLDGSFEEGPPQLPAMLRRDRRWCFGNLQHLWFFFAPGFRLASRFHMFNGIMAYVSSPLWLLALIVGTFMALPPAHDIPPPGVQGPFVFGYVMVLLFLPKILGLLLLLNAPQREAFGGRAKVMLSVLGEMIFSILLAPILMLFHSQFVLAAFAGAKIGWGSQQRGSADGLSLREASATHLAHTCFVLIWVVLVGWLTPTLLPWFAPVFMRPLISIPFSCVTASLSLGQCALKRGWFLIPEETRPPLELEQVREDFTVPAAPFFRAEEYARDFGLLRAVLDPYVNGVHVSLLRHRFQVSPRTRAYLALLGEKLLLDGPSSLTPREKRTLLWDGECLVRAHRKLWSTRASQLHEWWQAALRHYNESSALAARRTVSAL